MDFNKCLMPLMWSFEVSKSSPRLFLGLAWVDHDMNDMTAFRYQFNTCFLYVSFQYVVMSCDNYNE